MKNNYYIVLIPAVFFAVVSGIYKHLHSLGQGPVPSSIYETADKLYIQRADSANALEALKLYRELYNNYQNDPDAAWRFSMAAYFVGFNIEKNTDKQIKLFAEGREAGKHSLLLRPESVPGHFWTAVNMALYGQTVGPVKMLFTLGPIRRHLREVVSFEPAYAQGGSYRILGAIDEALPPILGGNKQRAMEQYKKAIEIVPDEPMNYLFLAKIYLKEFKDRKNAQITVLRGLAIPDNKLREFESRQAKAELVKFANTEHLQE